MDQRKYSREELQRADEAHRRRRAVVRQDPESGLDLYVAPLVIDRLEEPGGGWLSPEGRFYRCPDWCHLELARRLVLDLGWVVKRTRHRLNLAEVRLDRAGWLRVWDNGNTFTDRAGLLRRTQAQIDVMWDLAQRHTSMSEQLMDALRARKEAEANG